MRNFRFLAVLIILVLAAMACNAPAATAPTRPPTPLPLSTEEIQQFEEEVAATLANPAPSGEVSITITDPQINAYIASQYVGNPDVIIQEPQVHFADGRVELYGKVTQGPLTSDAKVVLKPRVEAGGKPKLDIESINIGALPVPDALVQQFNQNIDTLLQDYLASTDANFTVSSITVTEGQMTIQGTRQ